MIDNIFQNKNKPIKKLGFGLMRLPTVDGVIEQETVNKMVDLFLSKGFYYFDTAYGYHKGQSEIAIRKALVERHNRQDYMLVTKMPAWKHTVSSESDAKNMFYSSLEKTGAEYFDFYMMQNMGEERTVAFDKYKMWDFFQKIKEEGLVKYTGFSFHSNAVELDELLSRHPEVDFVQLQLNYADWYSNSVQSKKCYEVALKHGKKIIVMEPIKGGSLINLHPSVQKCFDESPIKQSNAAWALRFVASLENVEMVLSGMSSLEQMEENIDIFDDFCSMTDEEQKYISKAQLAISQIDSIQCTNCRYCIDECPKRVKIPKILEAMNIKKIHDNDKLSTHFYFSNVFLEGSASECVGCGNCEKICPQLLPIRKFLCEAKEYYGK